MSLLFLFAFKSKGYADADDKGPWLHVVVIPSSQPLDYSSPRNLLMGLGGYSKASKFLFAGPKLPKTEEELLADYERLRAADRAAIEGRAQPPSGLFSFISSKNKSPYLVGHAMVMLEEAPHQFLEKTASTDGNPNEERRLIFEEKIGFALAWRGTRGRLQQDFEIDNAISLAVETGHPITWVRIRLNEGSFDRVKEYVKFLREDEVYRRFALAARPRFREGMGCSSLGATCIEVSGALEDKDLISWKRDLLVPMDVIGDRMEEGKRVTVSVLSVVLGRRGRRWATENEPHRPLQFWEPNKMAAWISHYSRLPQAELPPGFLNQDEWTRSKCALGIQTLTIDARSRPVPTEPIFFGGSR